MIVEFYIEAYHFEVFQKYCEVDCYSDKPKKEKEERLKIIAEIDQVIIKRTDPSIGNRIRVQRKKTS